MPVIYGENGQRRMHIPCGCAQRKEIMFEKGKAGRTELLLVAVPILLLIGALYVKSRD